MLAPTGTRTLDEYEDHVRGGRGAFGDITFVTHRPTGTEIALKNIPFPIRQGIPVTIFREIQALRHLNHENVVKLLQVLPCGSGVTLAMERLMCDLSQVIEKGPISEALAKGYLQMILRGLAYLHEQNVMHRDLKPSNLLLSDEGCLKIADFGIAKLYTDKEHSHRIATRWYRAPEILLGNRYYDYSVDMWSVGVIFAEMINGYPLFPGNSDIDQISRIYQLLGTPSSEDSSSATGNVIEFQKFPHLPMSSVCPSASEPCTRFLENLLRLKASERLSAKEALLDDYFLEHPLPARSTLKDLRSGPNEDLQLYTSVLET